MNGKEPQYLLLASEKYKSQRSLSKYKDIDQRGLASASSSPSRHSRHSESIWKHSGSCTYATALPGCLAPLLFQVPIGVVPPKLPNCSNLSFHLFALLQTKYQGMLSQRPCIHSSASCKRYLNSPPECRSAGTNSNLSPDPRLLVVLQALQPV